MIRLVASLVAALIIVGACGPSASASRDPSAPIRVVTTSSVFADLVRNTGGERVAVTSLVPPGSDVHTYQAAPDDLRTASDAQLIVMNGLGLDDWLEDTLLSAGSAGLYVERIAAALKRADPGHTAEIDASAAAYSATLVELDGWVRDEIATIPAANRKLVMFHDALPYFARAYGLEVVGVAVEAPGQDPSAGEIAALIDAIRTSGVKAIFSEDQFPTALIDQIALETGATVVADLYDDSLGNPPVTSYEAVIRWDVEQIVEALR
jgi:ABC-type Zn uptake system ZnuABC Zn-binding protein ZnuA